MTNDNTIMDKNITKKAAAQKERARTYTILAQKSDYLLLTQ